MSQRQLPTVTITVATAGTGDQRRIIGGGACLAQTTPKGTRYATVGTYGRDAKAVRRETLIQAVSKLRRPAAIEVKSTGWTVNKHEEQTAAAVRSLTAKLAESGHTIHFGGAVEQQDPAAERAKTAARRARRKLAAARSGQKHETGRTNDGEDI